MVTKKQRRVLGLGPLQGGGRMHSRRHVGTNKAQPNGITISKNIHDSEDVLTVSDRATATAVKLASCEENTDRTVIATAFQSLSIDAEEGWMSNEITLPTYI